MGSLSLNRSIWSKQYTCHESQRTISQNNNRNTLSYAITLNVSVIIFTSPNKASFRLYHISDHIVNQSMLVPYFFLLELLLILFIIYFFENVLKFSIIFFQDGIFGCQIKWVLSLKCKLEAAMSELFNAFISIVHGKTNSPLSLKLVNQHFILFSIFSFENDLESSWLINFKVCSFVLISKCMSSNDNRFFPTWNESWNIADYNRFSKHCSIQNISDGSVWTFPHLLQLELLYSSLIRCNSCAFNSDFALLNSLCSIQSNLIISLIPILHAQVEVSDIEIQEGQYEFIFDGFPNNPCHLITVQFSNRILNFDFRETHDLYVFV